jgi:putative hydroxymethylpyrimidine transport system substrate-binding protein
VIASGAVVAGCGEKEEPKPGDSEATALNFVLDFYVNPDHAGIYTALENDLFARAGLDVEITVPSDPALPIKQVAAGRADLAISYEPEVLLARDQGLDVVAVASIVDEPLTSLIAPGSAGIKAATDLEGKTLATAGIPYQDAYLETILDEAGVPAGSVENVDVGFSLLPAVLGGRADAMLGGFRNVEGVDLDLRGENPVVLPVDKLGVPKYDELVLVANASELERNAEAIRLFIAALEKGTADAVADPAAATEAILDNGDGLERELTRAEIDATLPLLEDTDDGRPFGYLDPDEWEEFIGFMADEGQIMQRLETTEVLTNDLLPTGAPRK